MRYFVGDVEFDQAGDALDVARRTAKELASRSSSAQDVPVVREDGRVLVVRAYLTSRGGVRTLTRSS